MDRAWTLRGGLRDPCLVRLVDSTGTLLYSNDEGGNEDYRIDTRYDASSGLELCILINDVKDVDLSDTASQPVAYLADEVTFSMADRCIRFKEPTENLVPTRLLQLQFLDCISGHRHASNLVKIVDRHLEPTCGRKNACTVFSLAMFLCTLQVDLWHPPQLVVLE